MVADVYTRATIGGIQMNNRIIRAATHEGMSDENGLPTEQQTKLNERLAKVSSVCYESRSTFPIRDVP